jgi:hypothetical protein
MKKTNPTEELKEEPLVEVIPCSRVKEKDILILRCKKGEEKNALLDMRSELKALIQQKDLRILAVSNKVNFSQLSIMTQAAKEYNEEEQKTNEP